MAGAGVWAGFAAVCAAVAGGFLGSAALGWARRRRRVTQALLSDRGGWVAACMKGGCAPCRPLARRLRRIGAVHAAVRGGVLTCAERGVETTEEALLSLILAGSIGVGVVAGIVSLSVACGVASGCCALVGALLALRSASDRQVASMREAVPDALRAMIVCFRSGLSLLQTLQHASQEVGGSLGRLLGIAAKRLEVGEPPARALAALSEYKHIPELAFVAVALDVQHQSGGSIVAVLESACESVEGELELMRSLRVQTAQAKLSARIVTVMPFVLIALFSLISSDFLEPFFSSFAGMCLLGVALLMQAAGVLLVRRMLKVETA